MGNTNGIIDEGQPITVICIDCKKEFETRINVVTIKGKSHTSKKCKECSNKDVLESVASLAKHFKEQEATK